MTTEGAIAAVAVLAVAVLMFLIIRAGGKGGG
jgi:hypothetical protein